MHLTPGHGARTRTGVTFEDVKTYGTVAGALGVIFGGPLAAWKYLNARSYAARLAPSVNAVVREVDGAPCLHITYSLKNVGTSRVKLRRDLTFVFVGRPDGQSIEGEQLEWEPVSRLLVFQGHSQIESGEEISDEMIMPVPAGCALLRVELDVTAAGWLKREPETLSFYGRNWMAATTVDCTG